MEKEGWGGKGWRKDKVGTEERRATERVNKGNSDVYLWRYGRCSPWPDHSFIATFVLHFFTPQNMEI